ncbi:hypothetical protein J6590_078088 [Homalodisca vitripennis]|nr:hypothetical protein J6590_078088 [Homalodisca vitripennis]
MVRNVVIQHAYMALFPRPPQTTLTCFRCPPARPPQSSGSVASCYIWSLDRQIGSPQRSLPLSDIAGAHFGHIYSSLQRLGPTISRCIACKHLDRFAVSLRMLGQPEQ